MSSNYPELVIGIAGPIGVDIDAIAESIKEALQNVNYSSEAIKLTKAMMAFETNIEPVDEDDFSELMNFKMNYANQLCAKSNDPSFLARIAISAIQKVRRSITKDEDVLLTSFAYIIRQFKRPDEIHLMREVYGKQFILVSAYGSNEDRKKILESRCSLSVSTTDPNRRSLCSSMAAALIERDESEGGETAGQQLRDTFHLADVFIDGINRSEMHSKLVRFFRSFFGLNTAAPTRDEYGMYAAKSAALRSCDLSRQVGAAIFTKEGDIISQGCNEVPKAHGGAYWDLDEPDGRDIKIGFDANDEMKREIVRNTIECLWNAGMLSNQAEAFKSPHKLVEALLKRATSGDEQDGALVTSTIMDLTEFGRAVHAEMCAVCDAARLGRSTLGSTLYCTTFPCHNCAKHIVAAGVTRVVFMEPYPKSKAKQLHEDAIEVEKDVPNKVSFVPFMGISPFRYRDIFSKSSKRKSINGQAREWFSQTGKPSPLIDTALTVYPQLEKAAIFSLFGDFKQDELTDLQN